MDIRAWRHIDIDEGEVWRLISRCSAEVRESKKKRIKYAFHMKEGYEGQYGMEAGI